MAALEVTGELSGPKTMAIDDHGRGYVILSNQLADDLYTLNVSTGQMTLVGPVSGLANDHVDSTYFPNGLGCVNSFAFNPKDKNFYINCSYGPNPTKLLRLNVATGETSVVCDLGSFDVGVSADCGVQIGAAETVATNPCWESDAVVIGFEPSNVPSLAKTGSNSDAIYLLAISLTAMIAGAALMVLSRRFKARNQALNS